MSVLANLICDGAVNVMGMAGNAVKNAISRYGEERKVAFPDTEYYFPVIYGITGRKVETLADLPGCLEQMRLMIADPDEPDRALSAGLVALMGVEIQEALRNMGESPADSNGNTGGFLPDSAIRSLREPVCSRDVSGVAILLNKAEDTEDVEAVVRDYCERGVHVFLSGRNIGGTYKAVTYLGTDMTSAVHAMGGAVRAAMMFENVRPGALTELLTCTRYRIPAFVNTFGRIDAVAMSITAGAIALGFPAVVDIDLGDGQIPYMLESVCDHSKTVNRSLELRGIRTEITGDNPLREKE